MAEGLASQTTNAKVRVRIPPISSLILCIFFFFSFSKSKFYRTYRNLIPDPAFITHSKRSDLKIQQKKRLVLLIQLSRNKLQHYSKMFPKLYYHLQLRKITTTNMIMFHAAKKKCIQPPLDNLYNKEQRTYMVMSPRPSHPRWRAVFVVFLSKVTLTWISTRSYKNRHKSVRLPVSLNRRVP